MSDHETDQVPYISPDAILYRMGVTGETMDEVLAAIAEFGPEAIHPVFTDPNASIEEGELQ